MINPAYAHLLVNHLPLMAYLIALPLLLYALWSRETPQAFRAAVLVLQLGGIGTGISLSTGEKAEDLVEPMNGVETTTIHEHEEQAEGAAIGAYLAAVGGLILLFIDRRRPDWRGRLILVAMVLTTVATAGMAVASHSGGQIRHEEARPDFDPNAGEKKPAEVDL